MKRAEVTVENLKEKGYKPCYLDGTNEQYPFDETINLIKSGAKIKFETSFDMTFVIVDGEYRLVKQATKQEIEAVENKKHEQWKKDFDKKVNAKNIAKLKKHRRH